MTKSRILFELLLKTDAMYTQPANRKDVSLKFSLTHLERRYLQTCARKAGVSISTYLHGMMLQGYPKKAEPLPPEVRAAIGQLMQAAALLHPFSRKRLDGDDLNALERAEAREVIRQVQSLIQEIKKLIP
jgi:hypothetical protein